MHATRTNTRTFRRRLSVLLSTTALALGALGLAPGASAASAGMAASVSEGYVPFVTDFPRAETPAAKADGGAVDWSRAGTLGALGAAAAALAGGGVALTRRARPVRA